MNEQSEIPPVEPTPKVEAPNIIGDEIPGGARWFHNLGDEPVWIESRADLKREMEARGLVFAETKAHNPDDKSPWATRTRLRPGAVDPFLPKTTQQIETPPPPEATILYDPHGKPLTNTVSLDYQTASTLRTYFSWIVRAGFEPELYCKTCTDHSRESKATYEINEGLIDIWCKCRRILFSGHTKFTRIRPTLPPPETGLPLAGPALLTLTLPEGQLLREWKQVLQRHGLLEGLRCNFCFEANRADGTEARVTASHARIACRCRVYTFTGYTY